MPFFRRNKVREDTRTQGLFVSLGGRQYLDAPYILPKDAAEVNRLDFQHYMLRAPYQGNYSAPVDSPAAILDVGTGTGRWAMELADLFPDASVVGFDLVPPPLDDASILGHGLDRRPDNYCFVQGNLLHPLPFADRSFDFVHQRLLFAAIPSASWPSVIAELFRVTAPGGWIELVEGGPTRNLGAESSPDSKAIEGWAIELGLRRGIDIRLGAQIGKRLGAQGLANVVSREIVVPIGKQGGQIGEMLAANGVASAEALRALILSQGIATEQEYDAAQASQREANARDTSIRALPFYLAYGQRPASST